jgi:hypothetical protein
MAIGSGDGHAPQPGRSLRLHAQAKFGRAATQHAIGMPVISGARNLVSVGLNGGNRNEQNTWI